MRVQVSDVTLLSLSLSIPMSHNKHSYYNVIINIPKTMAYITADTFNIVVLFFF